MEVEERLSLQETLSSKQDKQATLHHASQELQLLEELQMMLSGKCSSLLTRLLQAVEMMTYMSCLQSTEGIGQKDARETPTSTS